MTTSLDASALLALVAKAVKVFADESDDRSFLAVPESAIAFTVDELNFGSVARQSADGTLDPGDATRRMLKAWADFSLLTNTSPNGAVLEPGGSIQPLWDVLRDVFNRAQLAETGRTAAEEAQYAQAMALLYAEVDGVRVPSAAHVTYLQFRDAYFAVEQEHRNRADAARHSGEAAERWTAEKPQWDAALAEATSRWSGQGRREEIDAARSVQLRLGQRDPDLVWSRLAQHLDGMQGDVLQTTDLRNFLPTAFAPADPFDEAWSRITLTADDIAALCLEASEELRRLHPVSTARSRIAEISFDYRSVAVVRPWLDPQLFEYRSWRLPEGEPPLSDGGRPAQGRFPALVTALVFARNIEVSEQPETSTTPAGATPPINGPLDQLDRLTLAGRGQWVHRMDGEPLLAAEAPSEPLRTLRPATVAPGRALAAGRLQSLHAPAVTSAMPVGERLAPIGATPTHRRARPHLLRGMAASIQAVDFRPLESVVVAEPAAGAAASGPTSTPAEGAVTRTPSDHIYVLAFKCRRLGKSPDPDPALAW
jgi:hypothetical protein